MLLDSRYLRRTMMIKRLWWPQRISARLRKHAQKIQKLPNREPQPSYLVVILQPNVFLGIKSLLFQSFGAPDIYKEKVHISLSQVVGLLEWDSHEKQGNVEPITTTIVVMCIQEFIHTTYTYLGTPDDKNFCRFWEEMLFPIWWCFCLFGSVISPVVADLPKPTSRW